jgi:hypothetical protein
MACTTQTICIAVTHMLKCEGIFRVIRTVSSTCRQLREDLKGILLRKMRFRLYDSKTSGYRVVRPNEIFDRKPLLDCVPSNLHIGCVIDEQHEAFMQRYVEIL